MTFKNIKLFFNKQLGINVGGYQRIYSKVLMDVIRPLTELRKPAEERIMRHLKFLRKSERWSEDKIRKFQLIRLRSILEHAYSNVPFYHDAFRKIKVKPYDIKNIKDLQKLPILKKRDIQANLSNLLAINMKNQAIPYSTGGSTGEPLKFYIDKSMTSWGSAARHRAWEWCNYRVGDKCALLWGSNFDLNILNGFRGRLSSFIESSITLDAFNMSNRNMLEYVKELKKFNPKVIRSYSSAMYLFSKFVKENDIKGIEPEVIITTAENLFDYQRNTIEEVFGCKVYDGYGSRETSLIAHECEANSGYHISDENSIVEFIKDGEHVAPGESGEIVITDLHNMVMPWIRYRIEDMGTPTDEKCNCGRTLSMMKSIDGRIHDFIISPDGRRIPGEFFPHYFKDIDGIQEYRIKQKIPENLLIEIVKKNPYDDLEIENKVKQMEEYLGNQMNINIMFVDEINWPASGKRRFTISEVDEG